MDFRRIERLLHVSYVSVINWVKKQPMKYAKFNFFEILSKNIAHIKTENMLLIIGNHII